MPNNYHHYALPTTSQVLKRKKVQSNHICQHSAPTSPRKLSISTASSITSASSTKSQGTANDDPNYSSEQLNSFTTIPNVRHASPLLTPPPHPTDLDYFPRPLLLPHIYPHDPALSPITDDPLFSFSPTAADFDIDPRSHAPRSASSLASFGDANSNRANSILLGEPGPSRRNNSISATHHLAKPEWAPSDLSFKSYMSQIALLDSANISTDGETTPNNSSNTPRSSIRRRWTKRSFSLSTDPLRLVIKPAVDEQEETVSYIATTPTTPIREATSSEESLEQQLQCIKKQRHSIYVSFPAIDDGSESEPDELASNNGIIVAATATIQA